HEPRDRFPRSLRLREAPGLCSEESRLVARCAAHARDAARRGELARSGIRAPRVDRLDNDLRATGADRGAALADGEQRLRRVRASRALALRAWRVVGLAADPQVCNRAFIVIFAFKTLETGHPSFALFASSSNFA